MIDLTRLTPAPWDFAMGSEDDPAIEVSHHNSRVCDAICSNFVGFETDLEFIALARNAFDVAMRRGWGVTKTHEGWWIRCKEIRDGIYPDPFTALVEADRWYRENVEAKQP